MVDGDCGSRAIDSASSTSLSVQLAPPSSETATCPAVAANTLLELPGASATPSAIDARIPWLTALHCKMPFTTPPDFKAPFSLVPAKMGPPGAAAIVVAAARSSCVQVTPPSTDCKRSPAPAPYTTEGFRGSTTMALPTFDTPSLARVHVAPWSLEKYDPKFVPTYTTERESTARLRTSWVANGPVIGVQCAAASVVM